MYFVWSNLFAYADMKYRKRGEESYSNLVYLLIYFYISIK